MKLYTFSKKKKMAKCDNVTNISYKNLLQEYCVCQNIPLPQYFSRMEGPSHKPIWYSYVVVEETKFQNETECPTKTSAEQLAAKKAYTFLKESYEIQPEETYEISGYPEWIALIDIENLQPILTKNNPVEYHVFLSEFSSVDTKPYEDKAIIHTIDSAHKDATDHLITFHAGILTENRPEISQYIILSRDRSSAILTTILSSRGHKVKHFKDVDSFHAFIKGL